MLAVTRSVVDDLRESLESRVVIEQAKGILMARLGCTADEAFQMLSAQSQHSHRRLRDVAQSLISDSRRRPPT